MKTAGKNSDHNSGDYTSNFAEVQDAEQQWQNARRDVAGVEQDRPTVGLALSGGGIRSATYNLGLLNALDRHSTLR